MVTNIVMLVKDRYRITEQCLFSLYENTPRDLFNLTIVNDGKSPMDGFMLRGENIKNVSILHNITTKNITGQARNLGVYWAEKYWGRGDWLYLSDNDMYFTPGWLEKLIGTAEGTEPFGFRLWGGWNHPYLQPHVAAFKVAVKTHDAVTGASQLMRWKTWDKFGPLDAHAPGVGQSEDWKFCQDIIKDGGKVGSIYPRVVFNCGVTNSYGKPSTGADVMVKELEEAKKRYPDLVWE